MASLQPEPSQLTFRPAFSPHFLAALPAGGLFGGPGEGGGGGTPFACSNIPACSFPGDETFVFRMKGVNGHGRVDGERESERRSLFTDS